MSEKRCGTCAYSAPIDEDTVLCCRSVLLGAAQVSGTFCSLWRERQPMCCSTCQHFNVNAGTGHLTCLVQATKPGKQYQLKYKLTPDHCCNRWEKWKEDVNVLPEIERIATDLYHYLQGLLEEDPRSGDEISGFAFWMSENSGRVHLIGRFENAITLVWRMACRPGQSANVVPNGPVLLAHKMAERTLVEPARPCNHCLTEMPGFHQAFSDLQDLSELLGQLPGTAEEEKEPETTTKEVQTGLF